MIECPKCQHQFQADFGMVACPKCGNFVVLDVDGNIQQDLTSMGISRPVDEPDFQTSYAEPDQQTESDFAIPKEAFGEHSSEATKLHPVDPEEGEHFDPEIQRQIQEAQEPAAETIVYQDPQAVVEESVQSEDLNFSFDSASEQASMQSAVHENVEYETEEAEEEGESAEEYEEEYEEAGEDEADEQHYEAAGQGDEGEEEFEEVAEDGEEEFEEEYRAAGESDQESEQEDTARERPVPQDDWANEQAGVAYAPEDMSEIESYGNSELSMAKDGQYLYDLRISGIDTSDIKQEVYELMTDRRLALNMKGLIKTVTNGVLEVQRLNAIKTSIIVNRLKSLPVLLQWRQNVITQVDPE